MENKNFTISETDMIILVQAMGKAVKEKNKG